MDLQDLKHDLEQSQSERANLLQQREQLDQQLEMVNTQIGHCEGGLLKLQELIEREGKKVAEGLAPHLPTTEPTPPKSANEVDENESLTAEPGSNGGDPSEQELAEQDA